MHFCGLQQNISTHKYSTNQSTQATTLSISFLCLAVLWNWCLLLLSDCVWVPLSGLPRPPLCTPGQVPALLSLVLFRRSLMVLLICLPHLFLCALFLVYGSCCDSSLGLSHPEIQSWGPLGGWRRGPQGIRPSSLQECMHWEKQPLTPRDGQSLKHTAALFASSE